MSLVLLHEAAEEELEESVAYYEDRSAGLGIDFAAAVEEATRRIEVDPLTFPRYEDTALRMCLLNRFPFTLYFQPHGDVVWIVAIAHQKRRPAYWSRRRTL